MALDATNSSSSSSAAPAAPAAPAVDLGIYILVIVQFIIGIFGIILNSFVVYVTIKYKQFRKLTNYLLGFICFCDAIYGTAGIVPFITITGHRQIPLSVCFFLASPSPFSVTISLDLMLFLGLERLVSVLFPIWYHSRMDGLKKLAFPLLAVCGLKNSYIFYLSYQFVSTAPDLLVYCQTSDLIQGSALGLASNISLISNIFTLVIYFLLWATIKFRKIGSGNSGMGHQLNQSIFVLVIIYLFFWMTTLIGNIVLPSLAFDNAVTRMFCARLLVQLTRLATVLNAPVLYFCSTDYRAAFRKEMCRFIGCQHPSTLSTKTVGVVHRRIGQQRNAHQQQQQGEQRRQPQPMINNMMTNSSN